LYGRLSDKCDAVYGVKTWRVGYRSSGWCLLVRGTVYIGRRLESYLLCIETSCPTLS
jgi:hypothetical protein